MVTKAEQLRDSIQTDKAEQLRGDISDAGDVSQYSPAVMQNKALLMLAESDLDSLYDVTENQIPYIAYLRALNQKIPIPGTMAFIAAQLSLSRSKDRQGRREFGQALNKQPVILPGQAGTINLASLQAEQQKEGFFSKLFKRKKTQEGSP